MFEYEHLASQPLFYLFIAFSLLLGYGYFWGKKVNFRLFRSAFNDLVDVVKPVDQTFTNIGGLIGYHANLVPRKSDPVEKVEATITFLPRHSWLWLPVSKLIRKYDRLFITMHLKSPPAGEGHLIETGYAGFRGPKITNAEHLRQEQVKWGSGDYRLYYQNNQIRDKLTRFLADNPEPGLVLHIALVPELKRCFVFMIPRRNAVGSGFAPIYRWLPTALKGNKAF